MKQSALSPGFILVAIALAIVAALPFFFQSAYFISYSINVLQYGVLATAWTLFSGPTRYISLATTAFFGIGAYTVAVLSETLPWFAVLGVAGLIGIVLALVVGLSTLRLSGVHFVIFTFGLAELIRQLVTWYEVNITRVIGRYIFLDITQEQIYWQLVALLALVLLTAWIIQRSRLGLALRVIGEDELVARHLGMNTTKAKVSLFVISATFMTLVGAIMSPRWTYIDPGIVFNPTVSFQVLIMALLGGVGHILGPLAGVIPLTALFEVLSAKFPNHFSILLGAAFLIIVYLVPNGIADVLRKGVRPRRRKPSTKAAT
ncbi:MAG TPA: branched-chain amino acid ABC transporter permease [Pusillimonas sp.]|uniref:branched-chain amino acid ABC transporter permease n=1 Tax=unclassified Pusillimonas TaxID=2640016 RepID=UPI00263738C5|nr:MULTISPECIES: branched-chain amino acid ABC transporter permease [unclassified Pusillimonas]HLU19924.1 branched-chain amino acid ABC transporter permease [Pusillimonas sp.]